MLNHVFYKIYLFVKLVPKGTVIQLKKVLRSRQAKKILIVIWPFLKKQELEVLWLKNSKREYQEVGQHPQLLDPTTTRLHKMKKAKIVQDIKGR